MNKTERPVIVPTALSTSVLLWSAVFVAAFGAALFAYSAWSRLDAARARLAAPVAKTVETDFFRLTAPVACCRYVQETNRVVLYFHEQEKVPFLSLVARRDAAFAYRALDFNPALLARQISSVLRDEQVIGPDGAQPNVIGTTLARLRQGTPVVRAFFNLDAHEGLALAFYAGDVSYLAVAVWNADVAARDEAARDGIDLLTQGLDLPKTTERFARPIIDSAALDAAEHARIDAEEDREHALWKLYAQRVATEPEAALLPAIEHFRRRLTLASSVHEESDVLASEDFQTYLAFLRRRTKVVDDWFVLLDKYRAVGDLDAAREQAEYIRRHATLEDESLRRRQAAQALAAIDAARAAALQKQKGKK